MLEKLQRRNYNPDTIRGYIHAVKEFADYFGKSPELMGAEEVREFQLHMIQDKKLALGTVALRMGALRVLYKKTLRRRDIDPDDLRSCERRRAASRSQPGGSSSAHRSCAEPAPSRVADAAVCHRSEASRSSTVENQRHRYRTHADPCASVDANPS